MTDISIQLKAIQIENPESLNMILGQSHFVKTVEDIHEALVNGVPGVKFGLAFCESSGLALVRSTGTDDDAQGAGRAQRAGAGRGPQLHLVPAQRLSGQCPERDQDGARGGQHLLRQRQPGAGDRWPRPSRAAASWA